MELPNPRLDSLEQPSIVAAEILFPSDTAHLKIMFPMVSEIRQAEQLVAEAMAELDERGVAYWPYRFSFRER